MIEKKLYLMYLWVFPVSVTYALTWELEHFFLFHSWRILQGVKLFHSVTQIHKTAAWKTWSFHAISCPNHHKLLAETFEAIHRYILRCIQLVRNLQCSLQPCSFVEVPEGLLKIKYKFCDISWMVINSL